MVKLSGHERVHAEGPARVFENEEAAMAAVTAGEHRGGRRRRDPQRGPRRRPRDARDARGHRARSWARGSATTSRSSPTAASPAPPTASWSPTSRPRPPTAARSPRSRTATRSRSTSPRAASTSTCPTTRSPRRVAAYVQPPPTATNGVFGKYAKLVSSASEGAVTRLAPLGAPRPRAARGSLGEELAQQRVEALGRSSIATWPVRSKTTRRESGISSSSALGVLDRHERVVRAPDDQRRAGDLRQLLARAGSRPAPRARAGSRRCRRALRTSSWASSCAIRCG